MKSMKMNMKIGRSTLTLLVMLLHLIPFPTGAVGQETPFTLASLQGTYAGHVIVASGGVGVGAIGTFTFDGAGNFSNMSTWNVEGEILQFATQGTYTVSSDGLLDFTGEEGGAFQSANGVITRSRKIRRRRIALDVSIVPLGLGPGDNVITLIVRKQSE